MIQIGRHRVYVKKQLWYTKGENASFRRVFSCLRLEKIKMHC